MEGKRGRDGVEALSILVLEQNLIFLQRKFDILICGLYRGGTMNQPAPTSAAALQGHRVATADVVAEGAVYAYAFASYAYFYFTGYFYFTLFPTAGGL